MPAVVKSAGRATGIHHLCGEMSAHPTPAPPRIVVLEMSSGSRGEQAFQFGSCLGMRRVDHDPDIRIAEHLQVHVLKLQVSQGRMGDDLVAIQRAAHIVSGATS